MALTLTLKHSGTIGNRKLKCFEVTADGSTVTITASNVEFDTIDSAMITSKANLEGTASWTTGSISDGAMEAQDITVTGAAVGDIAEVSYGADVADLGLYGDVTATNVVTAVLVNWTSGALDIANSTIKATVFKNIGLSTLSGASIVFGPALSSGDKFTLWVVGY